MHAWFSAKQAKIAGIVLYESPTGEEIECTDVTDTVKPFSKWDNLEYRGEVTRYLRRVTEPDNRYRINFLR